MRRDWTSPEGFKVLIREHQNSVFGTLHRLTGPGPHVEDLAQEVFLPDEDEPSAWLENQPANASAVEHTQTPEQLLSERETQQVVENALLALPEAERAVLVLFTRKTLLTRA